jgi:hypothetical protein
MDQGGQGKICDVFRGGQDPDYTSNVTTRNFSLNLLGPSGIGALS